VNLVVNSACAAQESVTALTDPPAQRQADATRLHTDACAASRFAPSPHALTRLRLKALRRTPLRGPTKPAVAFGKDKILTILLVTSSQHLVTSSSKESPIQYTPIYTVLIW